MLTYNSLTWSGTIAGKAILPGFDKAYYLAHNPDVAAAGVDPLQHYMTFGWKEGRDPDAWFSTTGYLARNPDVAAANVNPLLHYEQNGWAEGRDPSTNFSLVSYYAAHPGKTGTDPLITFMQSDEATTTPNAYAQPETRYFDGSYYLSHNPDVAAAHLDPLLHYQVFGWHEGRDPSAAFSTNKYLASYSDVRAANIDPLAHYANYGRAEGRLEFSV